MELPPFQALLDAHGHDVHRFLVAGVGPGDADDCYQETMLAALRAYPRLRDAANLRGWLFTIAHRKSIDDLPEPTVTDPELRDGTVWVAVRSLPPKQRTAVALRFGFDADYGAIAAVLDCSEEAARRSVHEGLKRLRREVER